MIYNVDIAEIGEGRFKATVREYPGHYEISRDPEHDVCHSLTTAGCPDGPVQFWRDAAPTLLHSSMHKMGERRIGLDAKFPHVRAKRKSFDLDSSGLSAGGFDGEPGAEGDDKPMPRPKFTGRSI